MRWSRIFSEQYIHINDLSALRNLPRLWPASGKTPVLRPEPKLNKLWVCASAGPPCDVVKETAPLPVCAPVGLGGSWPGNYTALTTGQERKDRCHRRAQKHLFASMQITYTPPAHTRAHNTSLPFFLVLSHTYTHTRHDRPNTRGLYNVKEDHSDFSLTRRYSCSASCATVGGRRLSTV